MKEDLKMSHIELLQRLVLGVQECRSTIGILNPDPHSGLIYNVHTVAETAPPWGRSEGTHLQDHDIAHING
jgi:hypothetical protein